MEKVTTVERCEGVITELMNTEHREWLTDPVAFDALLDWAATKTDLFGIHWFRGRDYTAEFLWIKVGKASSKDRKHAFGVAILLGYKIDVELPGVKNE